MTKLQHEGNMEIPTFRFAIREDLKDTNNLLLPTRGEPLATGWDVQAATKDRKPLIIKPSEYVKIPLGFRAFCPEGWWLKLVPRSSSFTKRSLHALYGTIDETWEGEMLFAAQYFPEFRMKPVAGGLESNNLMINFGEAIGQIIPVKREEMIVETISNEEYDALCGQRGGVRGGGGFGSTTVPIEKKDEKPNE